MFDFVSVALFSQIQSVGIVDGQEGGLFGTSPDCITVSTATTIFEDSSTNLVSNAGVPVELIPSSISVDGSIQEIVTETIQPVTPEKVLQILQRAPFHFFCSLVQLRFVISCESYGISNHIFPDRFFFQSKYLQ